MKRKVEGLIMAGLVAAAIGTIALGLPHARRAEAANFSSQLSPLSPDFPCRIELTGMVGLDTNGDGLSDQAAPPGGVVWTGAHTIFGATSIAADGAYSMTFSSPYSVSPQPSLLQYEAFTDPDITGTGVVFVSCGEKYTEDIVAASILSTPTPTPTPDALSTPTATPASTSVSGKRIYLPIVIR